MNNYDESLDVAVIGMSMRAAKARNYREFWKNISSGRDCITRRPEIKKQNFIAAYGKMDDIEYFDADFFGIKAAEAMNIDPQQRNLMEGIYQALEDAGYTTEGYKGKIGLYLTSDEHLYIWNYLMRTKGEWLLNYHESELYLDGTFSTFIAYYFNIQGPCAITRYACASSLACLHNAYQGLLNYECDMAIVGGVNIEPEQEGCNYYASTVSRTGYLRPFDENADGLIKASGQGVVILKRIGDAVRDHDNIVSLVKGTCVNNDGNRKAGFAAPSVQGQQEAISTALSLADVKPEQVGYFESHGTATVLGDTVELRALKNVFASKERKKPLMIGSVKANIGHTSTASGVINLIKTSLMLKNGKMVPTINYSSPNSELKGEESRIRVNTEYRDWESDGVRTAGISAIGMGGANAVAVLSEFTDNAAQTESCDEELFIFSSKKKESLDAVLHDMKNFFSEEECSSMRNAAYTLQAGRNSFSEKYYTVAKDAQELCSRLENRRNINTDDFSDAAVIFVFGGAGTQSEEMCLSLYRSSAVFRKYADRCFDIYAGLTGNDIREKYLSGEAQRSSAVEERFMLLFTAEYALAEYWKELGIKPDAVTGHSFGEYAAACVAGVTSPEDMIYVITERGKLYNQIPDGAMLSVAADRDMVSDMLEDGVTVSAENGDKRIMLSGTSEAIEKMSAKFNAAKIPNSRLNTSKAGHCSMTGAIAEPFRKVLEKVSFKAPDTEMIPTCRSCEREKAFVTPEYWTTQMQTPVEFRKAVSEISEKYGKAVFIEISPVNQLNDLVRREIRSRKDQISAASFARGEFASERGAFLETAGMLWSHGFSIDWEKLYNDRPYRTSLPAYHFYGKPYWRYKKYTVCDDDRVTLEDTLTESSVKNNVPCLRSEDMTETEKKLWKVINEITGFESFGVSDDLYELGIDSLTAVLLVSKIESHLGKKIGMKEIYSARTLREIAVLTDNAADADSYEETETDETEDISGIFN